MSKLIRFDHELVKMKEQYRQVLPAHMNEDRLGRIVRNAVSSAQKRNGDNKLLDADRTSFWNSVMTVAVLGLDCDGVTGQAYLVPFGGKVQAMVGYAGYVSLAANAGFSLYGKIVYEADTFSYQEGTNPVINHLPDWETRERGGVIAAYAVARSNQLPHVQWVCGYKELQDTRDRSAGYRRAEKDGKRNSTWHVDFDAMCRKTPIRRLGKNMPLRVHQATEIENIHERGGHAYIDPEGEVQKAEPIELEAETVEVQTGDVRMETGAEQGEVAT